MYHALPVVKWKFAMMYCNDIVLLSSFAAERIYQLKHVLPSLRYVEVTLKLKKCKFFTERIHYQSHAVCKGREELASHTTDDVNALKAFQNVT